MAEYSVLGWFSVYDRLSAVNVARSKVNRAKMDSSAFIDFLELWRQ